MTFLRNFEDDVFISYSSTDDELLYGSEEGWVTRLHHDLEGRLKQLLGRQLKIWRDDQELQLNDELTPTLIEQLGKSGVLLTVVSPPYFDSRWCMKEFHVFCNKADKTGGLRVQNKSRIFKVVKTPVMRDEQPSEMRGLVSYDFYEKSKSGTTLEYNWEYGDKKKYVRKLNDLAYGIANFLRLLSDQYKAFVPRATVYLADTTPDLREQRDEIWRDLLQRGFAVLPDEALAPDDPKFRETVRSMLQRSAISIHLFGQEYGEIPTGEAESSAAVEAALAAERCTDPKFLRIIWMATGLKTNDLRQQKLIEILQNDSSGQERTELLQTKLEDLKTFLEDWFGRKETPVTKVEVKQKQKGPQRIYIMADAQDLKGGMIAPLEEYLYDQGYEIIVSYPGEDVSQARDIHYDHLRLCDGCMIFYGQGDSLWLESKQNDLRKVVDARLDPVRSKVIYVAGPETDHKLHFRTREALVIKNFGDFSGAPLAPLLQAMLSSPK